ncbi:hypothetical protein BC829DRAFT_247086 [Chytridium lagenaria]|nr:hypothetical protein BC829DRAFT_247086 [Chytridium lagenaria]
MLKAIPERVVASSQRNLSNLQTIQMLKLPQHYDDWVKVRDAIEAKGYVMPTLADYKRKTVEGEDDPAWLAKWKVLPEDETKIWNAGYDAYYFIATRQPDGVRAGLKLLKHGSQELKIWNVLKQVSDPTVFPKVLDLIETTYHDVLVLEEGTMVGTYNYPGGLKCLEDLIVAYRFWIELLSVLHSHNISLRVLDEDLIAGNNFKRSDPQYRGSIKNLEYAVIFDANKPPMISGLPPIIRYRMDVPEWSKTDVEYDSFKFDIYCVGSYIIRDLKGRKFDAPELESLCTKMTAADSKDIPSASEILKEYNTLFPSSR